MAKDQVKSVDTQSGKATAAQGDNATMPLFDSTLSHMQSLFLMVPHMQAVLMKAALNQQKEMFCFAGQRCEADLALAENIGAANNVQDMMSAYLGFYKDAAQQYAQEAGKATEIGSDIALVAVSDIEKQARAVATELAEAEAA